MPRNCKTEENVGDETMAAEVVAEQRCPAGRGHALVFGGVWEEGGVRLSELAGAVQEEPHLAAFGRGRERSCCDRKEIAERTPTSDRRKGGGLAGFGRGQRGGPGGEEGWKWRTERECGGWRWSPDVCREGEGGKRRRWKPLGGAEGRWGEGKSKTRKWSRAKVVTPRENREIQKRPQVNVVPGKKKEGRVRVRGW